MLNSYGLIIMIVIMIPNIIYGIVNPVVVQKYDINSLAIRKLLIIEQIGRFASMFFMVFNIGILEFGTLEGTTLSLYLVINSILILLYLLFWCLYYTVKKIYVPMMLAIIPTIIFFISGILLAKILLIISSIIFGIGHITISYINSKE